MSILGPGGRGIGGVFFHLRGLLLMGASVLLLYQRGLLGMAD